MSTEVEFRTITGNYIFWLRGDAEKLRDQMRVHWDMLNAIVEADLEPDIAEILEGTGE
jgi:hypothetical protein